MVGISITDKKVSVLEIYVCPKWRFHSIIEKYCVFRIAKAAGADCR